MRYVAGLLAVGVFGATMACAPKPPLSSDQLPKCFAVDVGAWSSPPPFDFPFSPVSLVVEATPFVPSVLGDSVGQTAMLTDDAGRSEPWAWEYVEGLGRAELFQPLGGVGGYELYIYPESPAYFRGEAHWWVDRGSRGSAPVELTLRECR